MFESEDVPAFYRHMDRLARHIQRCAAAGTGKDKDQDQVALPRTFELPSTPAAGSCGSHGSGGSTTRHPLPRTVRDAETETSWWPAPAPTLGVVAHSIRAVDADALQELHREAMQRG